MADVDLRSNRLHAEHADVGRDREAARQRRLRRLGIAVALVCAWLWWRILSGSGLPAVHLTRTERQLLPLVLIIGLVAAVMVVPLLAAGRSPHVLYRPEEIDVGLDDVKGLPVVVEEATRTLNLFLAHATFRQQMGGQPRRAMLFEGAPGTGKTHLAKALAHEAGVPFLFVSSSAFQSMFYGQTNRKIRSYFGALRAAARREGGAIGFIEEIDAIGSSRSGMRQGGEGIAGVVNELLVQLQSFDEPPASIRLRGALVDLVNRLIPAGHRLRKPTAPPANILVIGATNRAADLDPALLRPGRFDRTIGFDVPSRAGRREILDHALATRAHDAELDEPEVRDRLAASTAGASPADLVHLLDEALVWALRRGAHEMSLADVQQARLIDQVGLAQPVEYTAAERRTLATHEAGHAAVAWLVGSSRRLEVLSIIKRREALGLLSHTDSEERFTQTKEELEALLQIAFGGLCAEEVFFGSTSSGPAGDLRHATELACTLVGGLGMAGSYISYEAVAAPGNLVAKVLSNDDARRRVDTVLTAAHDHVVQLLEANRPVVERLRDALLAHDELVGDEIIAAITTADTTVDLT